MIMDTVKLTKRESEIAELFAWGASKKDIANRLYISERTVENHARNIYVKIGCQKVNELSAWWFCTNFHISFDLSPLTRRAIATCLLVLVVFQMTFNSDTIIRAQRTQVRTTRVRSARRKNESDNATFMFNS